MIRPVVRGPLAALAAALLALAPAHAQTGGPAAPATGGWGITVAAGVMSYDRSVAGNAAVLAVRGDLPLGGSVRLEPGVAVGLPSGSDESTFFIPEVQVQAGARLGVVEPYAGLGLGLYRRARSSEVSFSLGAGARVGLTDALGVVVDGRIHGIGAGVEAAAGGVTVGVRWRPGAR
ncbi:MAG TPA: outer membrane beta-barrel protein [Longimicrobium sp.]